jgi:hypothetical protein
MASNLIKIQKYMWDNYNIPILVGSYSSETECTCLNEYNGADTSNLTGEEYVQLFVRRTDTNSSKAYEKAKSEATDIIRKIRECTDVMNINTVMLGFNNNSYEYVYNFRINRGGI